MAPIARTKYPDIPLRCYFHSFGVGNESDAQMAIDLISKHGLYSRSKDLGLGNITGDLTWSLEYGKDSPVQILTVATNKHGLLKRSGGGVSEYGIFRKATSADKASLIRDIDAILVKEYNNEFFIDFKDNLRFLGQILPPDELLLAVGIYQNDRDFLNSTWKEIKQRRVVERSLVDSVQSWFRSKDNSIFFRRQGLDLLTLPEELVEGFHHNEAVSHLYEIFVSADPTTKISNDERVFYAQRAYDWLIGTTYVSNQESDFFRTYIQSAIEFARDRGIKLGQALEREGGNRNAEKL